MLIGCDSPKSGCKAAVISLAVWPVWSIVWEREGLLPSCNVTGRLTSNWYFIILSGVSDLCRLCSCWHPQLCHPDTDGLQQLEMPERRHRNTLRTHRPISNCSMWPGYTLTRSHLRKCAKDQEASQHKRTDSDENTHWCSLLSHQQPANTNRQNRRNSGA